MTMPAVEFNPLRDKRYQATAIGADILAFLTWLELGGGKPKTSDQYERDLARGAMLYPNTALEDWTGDMLLQVAKSFKEGGRRSRMAAWKSFYKWARKTQRVSSNPTEELPTFKQRQQKFIDTFSDAENALLVGLPSPDGALMRLLVDGGLRKSEARAFQLKHYRPELEPDAPHGRLVILDGKGGKDRTLPATQALAQALADLATLEGLNSDDFLWYSKPGGYRMARAKPVVDSGFHAWWVRCLDAAGVRYRNPHTTRHTFATRWLKRGGRLETLSKAMGHSSIATTANIYGHLETSDIAKDLFLVEGLIAGTST